MTTTPAQTEDTTDDCLADPLMAIADQVGRFQRLDAFLDRFDPIDLTAALGVLLVAIGIELRLGVDIAIAFLGANIVVYAVIAAYVASKTPELRGNEPAQGDWTHE